MRFALVLALVLACDGSESDLQGSADAGDVGDDSDAATGDDGNTRGHVDGWSGTDSTAADLSEAPPTLASCDPWQQTGCPAGEACDRSCATPSGLACRPAGAGTQDGLCSTAGDGDCAAGYTCAATLVCTYDVTTQKNVCHYDSARCTKICRGDDDCAPRFYCKAFARCGWSVNGDTRPAVFRMCSR